MASGFFALLDDIASLMDDVAVMAKVSTKKTAGILGDDLAVNAEKASGFVSSRELPVLWAITKGSFLNKLIILPIAFLLSAFVPIAVTIILVIGGLYLSYEGAEKIFHYFSKHKESHEAVDLSETVDKEAVLALEKQKIKSAIVTDFILSVEIVIIALGTVMDQPISVQIMVVSIVAILATVGVYGIVAMIVRLDDLGLRLINFNDRDESFTDTIGNFLVWVLPKIVKGLSFVGTIALVLVAGGIFTHNVPFLHHLLDTWPSFIRDFLMGLVIGFVVLGIVMLIKKLFKKE
ncbi:DUF808 domain-containing protein [Mangrovimonas sp. AS39]|uniref:DUF808 domain-containing protein n=1 Tax=Mangrovimonas futianensis TaxID=2895523 RepID=UPI001E39B120|nr:DUF808 domain-containing protein [Mangrovimonas futianensis]MCF1191207.1 DUF808 domain-containing protein [Mangrovimonas futianensis]MCF1194902.1 DUF808 domain-containing protein [Mangrovimonas futianensis]